MPSPSAERCDAEGARLGHVFARALVCLWVIGLCGGCTYARALYFNVPDLSSPSNFDNRVVHASRPPSELPTNNEGMSRLPVRLPPGDEDSYDSVGDFLAANGTRAILVVRDDHIVYERYFGGTNANTELPSFSVSKTFAALLIGCAVRDGLIESMDDAMIRYVPELAEKPGYDKISLDHLLRMTSGIDFDEESPAAARLYYTRSLRDEMFSYGVRWPAGSRYAYASVNIELLWEALQRRLGGETVAHYFERRVWGPIGAEYDASWSLDSASSGIEKLFAGFNARVRDQARLGLLFLHHGRLNGHTIVDPQWIDRSLAPDQVAGVVRTSDGWVQRASYQWFWTRDHRAYFAKGYNGQYVFVVPAQNTVIVRFGDGYGEVDWPELFLRIADNDPSASVPLVDPSFTR